MSAGHTHLFVHGSSPLHRLAPECKVAAAVAFVFAVAVTPREAVWAFGVYAALIGLLVAAGRLGPALVVRRLVIEVPFVLFALALPLVASGRRVDVAGLSLSVEGLWAMWNILAKATIGTATTVVLSATTPVPEIIRGLERLGVPRPFTMVTAFMVRYLDVIGGELRRARIALAARGYSPRWLWQARPLAASAGALFVRSYERGERVFNAMASRGFEGRMPDLGRRRAPAGEWLTALTLPAAAVVVAALAWGLR